MMGAVLNVDEDEVRRVSTAIAEALASAFPKDMLESPEFVAWARSHAVEFAMLAVVAVDEARASARQRDEIAAWVKSHVPSPLAVDPG